MVNINPKSQEKIVSKSIKPENLRPPIQGSSMETFNKALKKIVLVPKKAVKK